jgi:hypothetical protein
MRFPHWSRSDQLAILAKRNGNPPDRSERKIELTAIKIECRDVYGNLTAYPACPVSRLFAGLAGTKTLTADKLRMIEAAGFTIEVISPRVTFNPRGAR